MRLIDAEALLESAGVFEVKACARGCGKSIMHLAKAWLFNEVRKAPTIEVEPAKHGQWVRTEEPLGWHQVDCIECSNCRESWIANEDVGFDFLDFWKYCPNCGAKMDGGEERCQLKV